MKNSHSIIFLFFQIFCFHSMVVFGQSSNAKQILWTTEWSSDGRTALVGGNTDTLIFFQPPLKIVKTLPVKSTVTRLKWHPSQNMLAITTQFSAFPTSLYNLETNQTTVLEGVSPEGARGVDWNFSGEFVAIGDNEGQVHIFNQKGEFVRKFQNENTKGITAISWHPKKNMLVTLSDKIRLFDFNGTLLKSIQHRKEEVMLLSVAWHPTGEFFAIGDYGDETTPSQLQFWDENGLCLKTISSTFVEYRNLAWNKKGTRLATASDALRIWDKEGNLLHEGPSPDYLWGLAWNKKGTRILTSSLEERILLWNKKAKLKKQFDGV